MKIVVVDSFTLDQGELSWDAVSGLGNITVYPRTGESELLERCLDADIIVTNKVGFNKALLNQLPGLKLLAVTATGYNVIDIEAARNKNIPVCNVPAYGTDSVAQHTFALILELANRVGQHSNSVSNGDWQISKDFGYALTPLIELCGKTLGLVGLGNIGEKTAEIARAFGMNVLYHTPTKKSTPLAGYADLNALFQQSDFISLHLPLKDDNKEFVNKELIAKMKQSAFLINTSRGQLINEQDLADALNAKQVAGAALDVLSTEPPSLTNPLLTAKNCIITPHNAWMSKEARERIMEVTLKNIKAFLAGKPVNRVN